MTAATPGGVSYAAMVSAGLRVPAAEVGEASPRRLPISGMHAAGTGGLPLPLKTARPEDPGSSIPVKRHVAAFVTPTGPPITNTNHIRVLVDKIQARHSSASSPSDAARTTSSQMHALSSSTPASQPTSSCSPFMGTSPFVCETCGMAFKRSGKLRHHLKLHIKYGPPLPRPPPAQTSPSPVASHTRSKTTVTPFLAPNILASSSSMDLGSRSPPTAPEIVVPTTTTSPSTSSAPALPAHSPADEVSNINPACSPDTATGPSSPANDSVISLEPLSPLPASPSATAVNDSPPVHASLQTSRVESPAQPSSPVSQAPRSAPSDEVTDASSHQFPLTTCRRDTVVHLVFPVSDTLHCTEEHCIRTFHAKSWSQSRHSLCRHLAVAHDLTISHTENWCSHCHQRIMSRVSRHACFQERPVLIASGITHRWQCMSCDFSCQTRGGYLNHQARHKRERLRVNVPAVPTPRPRRRRERTTRHVTFTTDSSPTLPQDDSAPLPTSPVPSTSNSTPDLPAVPIPSATHSPMDIDGSSGTPGNHRTSTDREDTLSPSPISATSDLDHGAPDFSEDIPALPVEPQPSSPLDHFHERLDAFSAVDLSAHWDDVLSVLDDIYKTAAEVVRLPPPTDTPTGLRNSPPPCNDPKFIQKLYKRNRRRAVRLLTEGDSARCSISRQDLQDYFVALQRVGSIDSSFYSARDPPPDPLDLSPFTPSEVASRLHAFENSSPGHDRLTYNHWRSVDPECTILAKIFNICLRAKRIPQSWKDTRTILLFKKGDPLAPENWRPICLSVTIFKLFCGCLARRFTNWILNNDVLSPAQKGFLPFDGVFENNFIVQQRIQLARTSKSDLCLASLDIGNAFGALPHAAIFQSLDSAGVGADFIDTIRDLYDNSSTRIITQDGLTDPIFIESGVRQGCPLSGLLFNVAIDPILRVVQGQAQAHRILAYADDILLLASIPQELQVQLDMVHALSAKIGLALNPRKCFSLHLSGSRPIGTRDTPFFLDGVRLHALADGEEGVFLGKPIGFQLPPDANALNAYIEKCKVLLESRLAPWHRLDALKSFAFPSMNFDMRMARLKKTDWAKLDDFIRPLLKQTLNLPPEAANEYLFGDSKMACLGLPLAAENSDIARIDGAFKLLTSRDPSTQLLAWDDLTRLVSKRISNTPSPQDLAAFLSGSNDGILATSSNPISSIWSAARSASRRLNVTWEVAANNSVSLIHNGTMISQGKRHLVFRTLRTALKKARTTKLLSYPNQGKAIECAAAAKTSSHFFRDGSFTRFADWRFVHRARLNLVPLNGVRRSTNGTRGCRRYNYHLETLPHVICHCMRYSRLFQARHNAVVERIKKAAAGRWVVLSENQVLRGHALRPDLILVRDDFCLVLDITIPFDNRQSAFDSARREKIEKYRPLVNTLRRSYSDVRVDAIVVGALGSWDPNNDRVVHSLCSRRYASLMRKLIVSDTISFSRDVYVEHLTGVPQMRQQRQASAIQWTEARDHFTRTEA
ncbi:uncharacterized protein LOC118201920 [Stegodyphus dumicola]|uniref:uncharacterized protein LOC118201920 n=1 Tax=Stegodyphus dumicola TaxID=202533 RepID=UPI0015AB812A|nr:uncharacterized protein LOC118201920 [Stegodyphus dumicola]